MQTALAPKLRSVIAEHLEQASPEEIAQVVGSLAGKPLASVVVHHSFSRAPKSGFEKLTLDGQEILDAQDGDHVATRDHATGLIWSRETLADGKRLNHADATKACADYRLMGFSDWRLPTIKELLSIVDYSRHEPAIDTGFFQCQSACYWTSTPAAWNPADAAWVVYFDFGSAYFSNRDGVFHVRAVRSGQ